MSAAPNALLALVAQARTRQATDVHVEPAEGIAFRIFSRVERCPGESAQALDVAQFLELTLDRLARARLDKLGIADAVYVDADVGALRIHASRGKRGHRLAIRLLARAIPDLESLRLPQIVAGFTELRSGLVLFCGPSGSGKSTAIASLLERINASSAKHIITFEDPIEHTHRWLGSIVTQYEVGRDVASFGDGVRGSLRADPDILFIGELRDADTASACLQAAESGHLVFAALHTPPEAPNAVNRLIGLFGAEEQLRARLRTADALRAVVALRLLPSRDGNGLRPAAEVLIATDAVRRILRDGALHQLRSLIAAGRKEGMQTFESHLTQLVAENAIEPALARAVSLYPEDVRDAPFRGAERR
jgi:twitching motility protein PilT